MAKIIVDDPNPPEARARAFAVLVAQAALRRLQQEQPCLT